MSCESTGVNDRRLLQFRKINLLNNIGNAIVSIGVQNGFAELADIVDLNCGAVPEGSFEEVIDLNAPHQFLSLYMNIAECRFAMAVTKLTEANKDFLPVITDFCFKTGSDLKKPVQNAEEAFIMLDDMILDGMPCDDTKEIKFHSPEKVEWIKNMDSHEEAWKKAGGDLNVYYQLQKAFVEGLLQGSGITFANKDNSAFSLTR